MNFNKKQLNVINADEPKILCLAAAASGKTRVLTERIRHLIADEGVAPKDIVAITFTNLAADEMKKRLGDIANGMFIGTLHSYAARICILSNIDIQQYIDDEKFDKIIEKALAVRPHIYPQIKHLLVDECQDLNDLNYNFIERIPTENIFYVGDARQMIYGFRGASMSALLRIYDDPNFTKYHLTNNYRNTPQIIDFAEKFLRTVATLSPTPVPMKSDGDEVENCSFYYALTELQESENWGSWFILCRTNGQVQAAQQMLVEKDIPFISFKKGDFTQEELNELMASNKVKVLTIHTSKGLEAPNVIVTGGLNFSDEECRICYVAATRAQNKLYWTKAIANPNKKLVSKGIPSSAKTSKKIIEF